MDPKAVIEALGGEAIQSDAGGGIGDCVQFPSGDVYLWQHGQMWLQGNQVFPWNHIGHLTTLIVKNLEALRCQWGLTYQNEKYYFDFIRRDGKEGHGTGTDPTEAIFEAITTGIPNIYPTKLQFQPIPEEKEPITYQLRHATEKVDPILGLLRKGPEETTQEKPAKKPKGEYFEC